MSGGGGGGKKKSGFQITSVTSDYEQQQQQQQREGLASPTPPGGGGGGGDAGKKGPGGGSSSSSSPRVARGGPAPGEEGDPGGGGGGEEEEEEEEEGGGGKRANGGGSVSAGGAPNGPSGPPACSGVVVSAVSRFRVVKLDQGSGEPYKRGRWTCRDFYEPEAEPLLAAWAAASAAGRLAAASTASDRERQPHSLDSRLEAAAGLLLAKTPQGPFSPQPQRRGPPLAAAAPALHQHHQPQHHQQHHRLLHLPGGPGAPGYSQARSLGGLPGLLRPPAAPPSPGTLRSPLAAAPDALRPPGAPQETPSGGDTPAPPPGLIPTLVVEEPRLPNKKSVAQLIRGEADEPRRKVSSPRQSRSRPSSPAPPLFRDASPSRRTSDPFGAARFSLAQSMFGMGVAPHNSDDDRDSSPARPPLRAPREGPPPCQKPNGQKKEVDKTLVSLLLVLHSGTNSSLIAIDNKIEQAMDLVKSHLMFAVREEVEVLREQIKELSERNASLEQENALLRSLASAEQLGRFQAQFHAATKPSSSGGSSSSSGESSSSTTTTTTTTTTA